MKLKTMKQVPIFPLLQFENNALPFKIQPLQDILDFGDDTHNTFHSHNYYEMIWLINGGGTLYSDLDQFQIGNDCIFCIRPNQVHQFQFSPDMKGFVFSFTNSFLNQAEQEFGCAGQISIFQIFSASSIIHLTSESSPALKEIATLMIRECENRFESHIDLIKRYFRIFLIYLARHSEATFKMAAKSRETNLVKAFMELLDNNYAEYKMVTDYAEKLSVTPNYINKVIKKNTGFSAKHHIKQRLLLEAKRMVRHTNAGMKQIAYSLGFSDCAHFSKFFKSEAGSNFSDFKNLKDNAA